MTIQTMFLDPNAVPYTDDQIVAKINTASGLITRSGSVTPQARPIVSGEIDATDLANGVAKANLDAMGDIQRSYVKTRPTSGQYKVIATQRNSSGLLSIEYDDVAV